MDEKLLSVVQIANICTGHNNCHSYGSTFDLETGELVSLDELADIDADQLKMIIDDVLSENNIYGELGGDNYVIHHYAYEAAMNYEYYYDGEKFYIILNYIEGSGDGGIVVWNGKCGEEYAVEEFGYFVQPDGETLEKIVWQQEVEGSGKKKTDISLNDTSEVGGRSTENEIYALYASGVHEDNSASTNEFVWSERQINASFPQIYFSNEFAEYDKEIETKINQALFDEGICHDSCFLINRDIRGLVEYDMDYVITKANEEIFSIKYQGHLYSVDHGQNICSGITIDVKTGEKISLSELIALDDELLNQLQNGDIEYVDQAGYEKEMIIEIVQRFLDYYKKNLIDTDNCFYIEQDMIGLIVPVYQGNANYIILNIPIKQVDIEVYEEKKTSDGKNIERNFESFRDFPYENMDFIDEETFTFFKEVYGNIDFYGEFEMGDLTLYDAYIKAYKKLVCNEVPFIAPETGEEHYIEEYIDPAVYGGQIFDPHEFVYYHDASQGKMILWDTIDSSWERIHGTGELCWNWEGTRHTLCRLDENGEIIFGVYFMEEATWSNGKETFMVTVPFYADENKKIEMTQEMKEQAYYSEEEDLYFFNVTEEQYHELTEDFFEANDISEEKLKTIGYTYDELFGNGTLCETCNSNKAIYLVGR